MKKDEFQKALDKMDALITQIYDQHLPVRICENDTEWDEEESPWDVEYAEKPHYVLQSFDTLEEAEDWAKEQGLPVASVHDLQSLFPNREGEPLKFLLGEDPEDDCPVVWEGCGRYDDMPITLILAGEEKMERCYIQLYGEPFKNQTQLVDGIKYRLITNLKPSYHYERLSQERLEIAIW